MAAREWPTPKDKLELISDIYYKWCQKWDKRTPGDANHNFHIS